MKKHSFAALGVSMLLFACGDENTTNVYEQNSITAVEEGEALPSCSKNNDGMMTFVPDSSKIYFCSAGNWISLNGKDGADGKNGEKGDEGTSCDAVATKGGYNVVCGGVVKGFVKDGDEGVGCTAKDTVNADGVAGLNVDCGGKRSGTIWSGEKGDEGTSCDAVATEGGYNVVCGGVVKGFVKDGEEGTGCTANDTVNVDGVAGLNVDCGGERSGTIWGGEHGTEGTSCDAVATEGGYNIVCGGVVKGFVKNNVEEKNNEPIQSGDDVTGSIYDQENLTLTDLRDGDVYEIIVIGSQTWMAENLRYDPSNSETAQCSPSDVDCKKYGRYYPKLVALNACPAGWHVPSEEEFKSLVHFAGGFDVAGKALKSTSDEWRTKQGTDELGFSAIPAGNRYLNGNSSTGTYISNGMGNQADFWTDEARGSIILRLDQSDAVAFKTADGLSSVRCIFNN